MSAYLQHLEDHPTEYLSYFWWTDHYRVVINTHGRRLSMCELCRKLHDDDARRSVTVYEDLREWWWDGANCRDPEKLPWSQGY